MENQQIFNTAIQTGFVHRYIIYLIEFFIVAHLCG